MKSLAALTALFVAACAGSAPPAGDYAGRWRAELSVREAGLPLLAA